MEAQISFVNFNPAPDVRDYVVRAIEGLYELSPSDANLVSTIKRQGHDIIVELGVSSTLLKHHCTSTARSVFAALDKAIGEIEARVFDWKHTQGA